MANVSLKGDHSRWPYRIFMIICMVSTFALGWCLLQDFLSKLLQTRGIDELYGDIMHTGLIVCIFNIAKFYLLLCFGKKLEIVDLETDGNSAEETNDKIEDTYEDDSKDETPNQVMMEDEHTQASTPEREGGVTESRADLNSGEEQNFPEVQDVQILDHLDSTSEQDNEQVQRQTSPDNGGNKERILNPEDIQEHMHDSENKNIQLRRSTRDRKISGRSRSQSMGEGQHYKSSRRQDAQDIEPRQLNRSSIRRGDPGSSKSSQGNKSISNSGKTLSLYDLRHRSCFVPKEKS